MLRIRLFFLPIAVFVLHIDNQPFRQNIVQHLRYARKHSARIIAQVYNYLFHPFGLQRFHRFNKAGCRRLTKFIDYYKADLVDQHHAFYRRNIYFCPLNLKAALFKFAFPRNKQVYLTVFLSPDMRHQLGQFHGTRVNFFDADHLIPCF